MFQSNAQFFDAYRAQLGALQKEYNSKMQELNTSMRNYNPYNNNYNPYNTQQYTAPTQEIAQPVTPVATQAPVEQAPAVPVDLRILAILGEIKSLISDMKGTFSKDVVAESATQSGADSAIESVPSTETQTNKQDA